MHKETLRFTTLPRDNGICQASLQLVLFDFCLNRSLLQPQHSEAGSYQFKANQDYTMRPCPPTPKSNYIIMKMWTIQYGLEIYLVLSFTKDKLLKGCMFLTIEFIKLRDVELKLSLKAPVIPEVVAGCCCKSYLPLHFAICLKSIYSFVLTNLYRLPAL